ncbi:hypothetical protein EXIGLDRAFT_759862 [Exidia glandulosa HHB12029]|uniref:Uncharacterized protein n=1 Tax=Exidia glandulosa HHB12029 TaxID=1314781 RepID=A0A165PLX2_EXIGL|nr:hypothetical protein EXIGLDRAFT_759862 [Exidia glandulosa HHB12029]
MASLRVLKLWATYLDVRTMTLISKAAPTIEEMLLWYDDVHENVKLEAILVAHITTPKLQYLALDVDEMDTDDLPQFFHAVAPTVTSLVLEGTALADDLHHLQALYNVESLSFLSDVDDNFFVALAETSPVVWPKLTKVAIGSTGRIIPPTNDGIVQLVQARRAVDTLDNAIEAPRQIVEVDLRCKDVPNWIHATIDHLLASPGPDSATTM